MVFIHYYSSSGSMELPQSCAPLPQCIRLFVARCVFWWMGCWLHPVPRCYYTFALHVSAHCGTYFLGSDSHILGYAALPEQISRVPHISQFSQLLYRPSRLLLKDKFCIQNVKLNVPQHYCFIGTLGSGDGLLQG